MANMIELTDANFEQSITDNSKPLLVDFWAPWCGPCRMLGPILENLANQYGDKITFAKVNVDENPTAAIRFNIQGIPTVLIFKDGKVFKEMVGVRPVEEYQAVFQQVMDTNPQISSHKCEGVKDVNGVSEYEKCIATQGKVVLVDFWAPWCGPCRMLGPVLEKIAEQNPNILVLKVNVDNMDNQNIAMQYGVSSIPHVVIMKNGQMVDQFIGALPYETINDRISQYL